MVKKPFNKDDVETPMEKPEKIMVD